MNKLLEWCDKHNATFIAQAEYGFYYAVNGNFWYCPYEEM